MADIIVSAQSALNFNSGAGSLPVATKAADSTITFTQVARHNHINVTVANQINFTQGSVYNRTVLLSAESLLAFTDAARRAIEVSASNLLSFSQAGKRVIPVSATSVIGFANTGVTPGVAHGAYGQLTINQVATVTKELGGVTSSTLVMAHAASVYKANSLQPVIVVPAVPVHTPVILTYGSWSLTLKVPRFGNTDSIELSRVQRNSRAGDLIIWAHPSWPKTEILKFSFVNLSNTKAKEFLAFLDATLGQDITLTDHEGVVWTGFIITPETPITQSGREDKVSCGGFNCEFEFQGVPV